MDRFQDLFHDSPVGFFPDRKKKVGNYVLGRTLGEGSFAKVRLGIHVLSKEKVAVKIINKKAIKRREYVRKNLRREARLLHKLDHPNIVRLYEVMETDNAYYIVMELVAGGEFIKFINERNMLSEGEARRYMRQIVSAVDHMHRSGVIHRDLKIENILLDRDHNIKIIDFGLGNDWDGISLLDTQCGSPAYAAPEIFSKKQYGPKVDVWSIGINLYAMLTGKLPFLVNPANNLVKLHALILRGCKVPDTVSKDCQDLIRHLLESTVAKRMTMGELIRNGWINEGYTPLQQWEVRSPLKADDININVVRFMVTNFDCPEQELRTSLLKQKVNMWSATYFLLCDRMDKGLGLPESRSSAALAAKISKSNGAASETSCGQSQMELESVGTWKDDDSKTDEHIVVKAASQHKNAVHTANQNKTLGQTTNQNLTSSSGGTMSGSQSNKTEEKQQPTSGDVLKNDEKDIERKSTLNSSSGLSDYKDCLRQLKQRVKPSRSILKSDKTPAKNFYLQKYLRDESKGLHRSGFGEHDRAGSQSVDPSTSREKVISPAISQGAQSAPEGRPKSVRFTVQLDQKGKIPKISQRFILNKLADEETVRRTLKMARLQTVRGEFSNSKDMEDIYNRADRLRAYVPNMIDRDKALDLLRKNSSDAYTTPPPPPNSATGGRKPPSTTSKENERPPGTPRADHDNCRSKKPVVRFSEEVVSKDDKFYDKYRFKVRNKENARSLTFKFTSADLPDGGMGRRARTMPDLRARMPASESSEVAKEKPRSRGTVELKQLGAFYTIPEYNKHLPENSGFSSPMSRAGNRVCTPCNSQTNSNSLFDPKSIYSHYLRASSNLPTLASGTK